MKEWTDEEIGQIRADYRQAKNKSKQIGILADLNACTRKDIKAILDIEDTPEAVPKPKEETAYDITRLLQVKSGFICFTELLENRGSVPDGCLADLHALLVEELDTEIEKLEVYL